MSEYSKISQRKGPMNKRTKSINACKISLLIPAISISGLLGACSHRQDVKSQQDNIDGILGKKEKLVLLSGVAKKRREEIKNAKFYGYHLVNQNSKGTTAIALRDFWERVRTRTNGELNMTVLYKDAMLPGADGEAVFSTAYGRFDAVTANAPIFSNVLPHVANIMTLLFSYDDSSEGLELVRNKTFNKVLVEAGKPFNLTFIPSASMNAGMRVVTSNGLHPFEDVEDIDGFKLRIPPSKSVSKQLKALGVKPIQTPISSLLKTLKSNAAYGQENPPSYIKIFGIDKVQNTIWKTNHLWSGFLTAINTKTWESWPSEWHEIVKSESKVMQEKQWMQISNQNKQALVEEATHGMKVMPTNFQNISENKTFSAVREEIVMSLDPRIIPIANQIIDGKLKNEVSEQINKDSR